MVKKNFYNPANFGRYNELSIKAKNIADLMYDSPYCENIMYMLAQVEPYIEQIMAMNTDINSVFIINIATNFDHYTSMILNGNIENPDLSLFNQLNHIHSFLKKHSFDLTDISTKLAVEAERIERDELFSKEEALKAKSIEVLKKVTSIEEKVAILFELSYQLSDNDREMVQDLLGSDYTEKQVSDLIGQLSNNNNNNIFPIPGYDAEVQSDYVKPVVTLETIDDIQTTQLTEVIGDINH